MPIFYDSYKSESNCNLGEATARRAIVAFRVSPLFILSLKRLYVKILLRYKIPELKDKSQRQSGEAITILVEA